MQRKSRSSLLAVRSLPVARERLGRTLLEIEYGTTSTWGRDRGAPPPPYQNSLF